MTAIVRGDADAAPASPGVPPLGTRVTAGARPTRAETRHLLASATFDLLVVGGGIAGLITEVAAMLPVRRQMRRTLQQLKRQVEHEQRRLEAELRRATRGAVAS